MYGDSSEVVFDAQTQGKLYLALESDEILAMVGNFPLSLSDTELATYERTLYGGRFVYRSASETKYGRPDTEVILFGVEERSAHFRDELRATGGSLYYLSHAELVEGSEEVVIFVRDENTGLILSRQRQQQNIDYRIKYPEGRIIFHRPIASVRQNDRLVNQQLLGGNPVFIQVDYEAGLAFMPTLSQDHPGVDWSLSGAEEENRIFMAALARNSIIAILVIFIILATVFRSYIQPLIIMFIIPYGLVGAAFGHLLLGIPLSFLSFLGITALAGVLVNDSIVLIERINRNLAEGMSLHDSVCEGGRRRFRAIFLTSISTCAALSPLIFETDLQAQIIIPMAVSVAAGVAIGTMLTLILIPAFLVIMNDLRRVLHRVLRGEWPTPEQVEPALRRKEVETIDGEVPMAVS